MSCPLPFPADQPWALAELRRRRAGWRPDQTGTLLFLRCAGRVLLMRKRRGHGAGRINAPGGKLDPGETPLACAIRETSEEVGLVPEAPRLVAILRFLDTDGPDWLGYVFLADSYHGTLQDTPEGFPAWYPEDAIPYAEMWEDDRLWLPRILAGERLRGEMLFTAGRLRGYRLDAIDPGARLDEPPPAAAGAGDSACGSESR